MKKIYIITGNDEWLTHLIIKRLILNYSVVLVKVKTNSFNFIKTFKIIILIGILDFIKILYIQFSKKNYPIVYVEKKNFNEYLNKINNCKIFLVNLPFKINGSFKNVYNCHPSLLSNYKGLLPIIRNVYDLFFNKIKPETGVTMHKLSKNFDSGKIVWNKSFKLNLIKRNNFKKIYEDFYLNFCEGIDKVCRLKKIKNNKITKYKFQKKRINFYEIFKLKLKIL